MKIAFIFSEKLKLLLWTYSFNKNKITRSFILISFIYNLKIKKKLFNK